ncbi:MAG: AAA family ATPase [Proteobacteria bacterium]|nr:AAA family ATPase [Pseudomonadota bacterium]MBU1688946.1 AAA family ATPase [Pseudomonadota bacterium]
MTSDSGFPTQKDLEKEIGDYLSEKYGNRIKIVSTGLFPMAEVQETLETEVPAEKDQAVYNFRMKPEELIDYLDEYVVRQDDAKAVLATKICTHFNRIRFAEESGGPEQRSLGQVKNNILLVGPTGVGKTFLIKLIARKLGVPFVKGDATKFSETGYVGGDVEDLVRDLARQADGDLEKAGLGIIYVDEIDKIASSSNLVGHDISRTGVQRAFLKPMEETDVDLKVPHDPISQMEAMEYYRTHGKREKRAVNTRNILFIMSGAFGGLGEIVRKRVSRQSMGFESTVTSRKDDTYYLLQAKAEDLIGYGFESEFVGRLPVISVLESLDEGDLYQILRNPGCGVVLSKKKDFRAYGIKLAFEDESYREIARLAIIEKTGARGLQSVLERVLLPFEKRLPSLTLPFLVISAEMVLNPEDGLAALIDDPDQRDLHLDRYRQLAVTELDELVRFMKQSRAECYHRPEINISEERLALLARFCQTENMDTNDACEVFIELVHRIRECEVEFGSPEMEILFSEDAIDRILARYPKNRKMIRSICKRVIEICEYGFRLLSQKVDLHQVTITGSGIDEPEKFINDLVEKEFQLK